MHPLSKLFFPFRLDSHLLRQILAITGFISLKFLFDGNMGMVNEVDILPLAKQFVNPTWIPTDWYLNQVPGYRLLFSTLFGHLIAEWGFWTTSLIGRLLCYGLVALGLALIGQCLALRLPLLLTAIGIFLYANPNQGIAAQEWIVRALEAKSVAYGFVLMAIFCLLKHRYLTMAMLLGLATSFHVLVGGWSSLIIFSQLSFKHLVLKNLIFKCPIEFTWKFRQRRNIYYPIYIYLLFSAFAIPSIISHLGSGFKARELSSSFIYCLGNEREDILQRSISNRWMLKITADVSR